MKISKILRHILKLSEKEYSILMDNLAKHKEKVKKPSKVYSVLLLDIGPNKFNIVKDIREELNIGLFEAKQLVESVPVNIKTFASKVEADAFDLKLTLNGAKIQQKIVIQ